MKINNNVYYRHYGEFVYVYNVKTHKQYIFTELAERILDSLSISLSLDELVNRLYDEYDVEDYTQFVMDISEFVDSLIDEEIICCIDSDFKENDNDDANKIMSEICDKHHLLEHVYVELTHRCNENCIHCYIHNEYTKYDNELTYEEILNFLDELYQMGVMQITFTGGEPLVRDDFLQIMEYATKRFVVNFYSNLQAMTDDVFRKICEMGVNKISTSLYSDKPEIHDSITKVNGSYDKTLKYLLMFNSAGIDVSVKTIVIKNNEKSFESLISLLKLLDIEVEVSFQVLSISETDKMRQNIRLMEIDRYKILFEKYENLRPDLGCDTYSSERGDYICGMGKSLNIDPYGRVYPCNVLLQELGDLHNDNIYDIWNNSELLKKLRRFSKKNLEPKCQNCKNFNYCLYCPGACLRENGDMSIHIEESCLIASAVSDYYKEKRVNCNL